MAPGKSTPSCTVEELLRLAVRLQVAEGEVRRLREADG
jgi:hypothetical protein